MHAERIAEVRGELAKLRKELREAEASEVAGIVQRIDALLAELIRLGDGIVAR